MRFSALSTWHKYTISGNSCSIFIVKYGCNFLLLMTKWWDLGSCLLKGKTPVRRQSTARQAEFIGEWKYGLRGLSEHLRVWAPPLVHSSGIYGLFFLDFSSSASQLHPLTYLSVYMVGGWDGDLCGWTMSWDWTRDLVTTSLGVVRPFPA